ncbi:MAG: ABC transporter substrate-binding protein [Egibacteraceae bacterium]
MTTTLLREPVDELTRRRLLTGGAAAGLLIAAEGGVVVGPAAGAEPEGGAFPVTIEHKYGRTEIPAEPKRVVVVGEIEQDTLLALGIVPLAATEWLGDPPPPGAIQPWAQDNLGDAPVPEVLDVFTAGPQFERIAALRPDLILAVFSFIERSDYDRLAQIAPTVAQPEGFLNYGAPWQLMTRTVGRAVGQPERAEHLVADVEARFAEARAAHPEFARATALVVAPAGDGNYYAWPPPDTAGKFLADLGFLAPAGVAELAPESGGTLVQVSGERVDLFDADVLIWLVENASQSDEIRANPLYAGLDVATQGRDIFVFGETEVLTNAMFFSTVLSLPFAIDGLVPMLATAVDGDPTTTTGL